MDEVCARSCFIQITNDNFHILRCRSQWTDYSSSQTLWLLVVWNSFDLTVRIFLYEFHSDATLSMEQLCLP